LKKERVLITGASGGIGKAFAEIFAAKGCDLVLCARNKERLEAVAAPLRARWGVTIHCFPADLSTEDGADQIYKAVKDHDLSIDQLVNNAGAGKEGRVIDMANETMVSLITLNVISVTKLCRLIGADMARAGRGKILNVSSLGAFIPDPFFNVYGPTKAYELFLTLAMAGELKGTGVSVSVLCPGPVKTNWAKNAGKADSKMAKDPRTIARIGYYGMQRGKRIIVPTLLYKTERLAMSLLPADAQIGIIRFWQKMLIGRVDSAAPKAKASCRPQHQTQTETSFVQ
jgi:short-subunit dehydrogenase